jgi:hypothetical protein
LIKGGDNVAKEMQINIIGDYIELKRERRRGHSARISNDPELLEKVKQYTWTYTEGKHPYLNSGTLRKSLHRFVLDFVYGAEYVQKMIDEENIIEHLDNDGLNCPYDDLYIVSDNLNKAKAFTIDRMNSEEYTIDCAPAYITDVYYLHDEKKFQMQIFMNDDIFINQATGRVAEMFICWYDIFSDLYLDWLYLLNSKQARKFDVVKFHAKEIGAKDRPYIIISGEEKNYPIIERDGVFYMNLDAQVNGKPIGFIQHTARRKVIKEDL